MPDPQICPQCGRPTLQPRQRLGSQPGELFCPTCKWTNGPPQQSNAR